MGKLGETSEGDKGSFEIRVDFNHLRSFEMIIILGEKQKLKHTNGGA